MQPPVLTYGVVYSGTALKSWQASCIEQLERSGAARLSWIRAHGEPSRANAYERFCASLQMATQRAAELPAIVEQSGDGAVDFVLLLGGREAANEFSALARYGVWYFSHGDLQRFSTDAAGFWEIYCNYDITGASLLQLDRQGRRVVLKSGYLATIRESFAQNLELLFSEIAAWPAQVCRSIASGATERFEDAPPERVYYGMPNVLQVAVLRGLQRKNAAARYARMNLFSIDWNIFALQGSPQDFIGDDARAEVRSLCGYTKKLFLADPCIVTRNSQPYILCEEYSSQTNRGRIVAMELDSSGAASKPLTAIEEPYHLSFPQVFEYNGDFFCIAEAAGAYTLDLYRAAEFPYRWEKVRTLLPNMRAVDATLLRFNGKWWLFCTSGKGPREGDYSHLHIWYADDLFGAWTPHAANPVKVDPRSSRPAGQFFTYGDSVYRPVQDCSRTYGGAIRINRIEKLTETEFEETVLGRIRPPAGQYRHGIHTISCAGDWCIVDAKRYVFNPSGIVAICKDAAKALIRTARGTYVTKPIV